MNPFDLRGPEFLLFYALLAAAVLGAVALRRRSGLAGGLPSRIEDPCRLAALRAGPEEAVRVAILSLLDRRLLKGTEGRLKARGDPRLARGPLERAVLAAFAERGPAEEAFGDPGVIAAAEAIEDELLEAGLLARDAGEATAAGLLGAATLAAVAGVKLVVALSRGRTNVGFLILAGIAATWLALRIGARPRRTPEGEKALDLAGRAFARLKHAAATLVPGGQTDELALAFAVYGPDVLPPLARDLMAEGRVLGRAADRGFPARLLSFGGSSGSSGGGSSSEASSCGWSWLPSSSGESSSSWGGSSSCGGSSCGGSSCGGGCGGGGCGGCGS